MFGDGRIPVVSDYVSRYRGNKDVNDIVIYLGIKNIGYRNSISPDWSYKMHEQKEKKEVDWLGNNITRLVMYFDEVLCDVSKRNRVVVLCLHKNANKCIRREVADVADKFLNKDCSSSEARLLVDMWKSGELKNAIVHVLSSGGLYLYLYDVVEGRFVWCAIGVDGDKVYEIAGDTNGFLIDTLSKL